LVEGPVKNRPPRNANTEKNGNLFEANVNEETVPAWMAPGMGSEGQSLYLN
jgi:hypothetical protein